MLMVGCKLRVKYVCFVSRSKTPRPATGNYRHLRKQVSLSSGVAHAAVGRRRARTFTEVSDVGVITDLRESMVIQFVN